MGSQAPVMPDAWMHPLPCPVFGVPPQRGDSFWPRVLGAMAAAPGQGLHPFRPMLGCRAWLGLPPVPCWGRQLMSSPPRWAFSLLSQWELEEGEGWLGPSFSSSPADPAAFTDTLLTGIDWLGLSEGNPKRGLCL